MKLAFTLGFLIAGLTSSAHAQVTTKVGAHYREYQMRAAIANGETKTATLQINTDVEVSALGDPEIGASHGFYNYNITGSVVEGEQSCNIDLLISQSTGATKLTTAEVLSSGADRSGAIKLCSGLILDLGSVRTLLRDATMTVSLRVPELSKAIGTGFVTFSKIKEVLPPADQPDDVYGN